jgi:tetratricopeptide (TPR) repeat protein
VNEDILARLQTAKDDDERHWLAFAFGLEKQPPLVREAVWAAAISHWFDGKFLGALLERPGFGKSGDYQKLIGLSFVEAFPGRGYNVHERTRGLLLARLWGEERERYRELCRRAADYCSGQDQGDLSWRIEWIYHLLVADAEQGMDALQNTGWEWVSYPNYAYSKVEALVRAARELADGGRLDEWSSNWVLFWEALVDEEYARFVEAEEKFKRIPVDRGRDPWLAGYVAEYLGGVYQQRGELKAARDSLEEALSIFQENGDQWNKADCISALGDLHYLRGEYAAAQKSFEGARTIYSELDNRSGEARCAIAIGRIHENLGERKEAQRCFEDALAIYKAIGARQGEAVAISFLGDVHMAFEQYEAAREHYEEALAIRNEVCDRLGEAFDIYDLGEIHLKLGEYEAAKGRFEEALAKFRQMGSLGGEGQSLARLGDVHRALREYKAAQARYEEALAIYRKIDHKGGVYYLSRDLAGVYMKLGNYKAAWRCSREALLNFRKYFQNWIKEISGVVDQRRGK